MRRSLAPERHEDTRGWLRGVGLGRYEQAFRQNEIDLRVLPELTADGLKELVCDLVGSTALSARLDPEELRDVIGAYHRCVAETVRRFDGLVAKYMGDWRARLFRLSARP